MTQSEGHTYLKQHQLSGEALLVDLEEQTKSVLAEAKQGTSRRAARTLIKDGPLRMTIVGFSAGGSLRDHKAGGPVSISVLEGSVEIAVAERNEQLKAGQALVLGTDVMHSLQAPSDAVILLTVAMPG